jgi:fused signal recognition particle receptor
MFSFIKNSLKKIYTGITSRLGALFGTTHIDEKTLKELEIILLSADTGIETTKKIMARLTEKHRSGALSEGSVLKNELEKELIAILNQSSSPSYDGAVFLLVGINGTGKTTLAAKLAYQEAQQGKKVLLVAADTFRAAATEQLAHWAAQMGIDIVKGNPQQDPASVVFAGCQKYSDAQYDCLIIDTAGRLQSKTNLMHELAKIKRVVEKKLADQQINTLLTLDGMLGQNSLEQATLFKESTNLNGVVLTKMDGTGKGGIVFAISDMLGIPVWYLSYGEQVDQLKKFDKNEYVQNLLSR